MGCIFCRVVNGEIPSSILVHTQHSMALLDAFPLARGHVLVITKKHHQKIQNMTLDENADLFALVHKMMSKVDAITGATLVAIHNGKGAGQEIPHVHVHLVPRSASDNAGAIHSMFSQDIQKISDADADCMCRILQKE